MPARSTISSSARPGRIPDAPVNVTGVCGRGCPVKIYNVLKTKFGRIKSGWSRTLVKIIFGRTNYNKEISAYSTHQIFYNEQAEQVIAFCKERDIQFHIKNGTISNYEQSD